MYISNKALAGATLICLALFVGNCIWEGGTGLVSLFSTSITGVTLSALFIVLIICLERAAYDRERRGRHIKTVLLIVLTVCVVLPTSFCWEQRTWSARFFTQVMPAYEPMVQKIIEHKSILTDAEQPMDKLVNHEYVFAHTNEDGSVSIRFVGFNGWSRAGYFYYSGSNMMLTRFGQYYIPGNNCYTNYNYTHITNGWYDYN